MLRFVGSISCVIVATFCLAADDQPKTAGPTTDGFLLPNGWTLTPAGRHLTLTDLPLNIVPLSDRKHALVATSGYNAHHLSLVDLESMKIVDHQKVTQSWFGLTTSADDSQVWWAGGGSNLIHSFGLKDKK